MDDPYRGGGPLRVMETKLVAVRAPDPRLRVRESDVGLSVEARYLDGQSIEPLSFAARILVGVAGVLGAVQCVDGAPYTGVAIVTTSFALSLGWPTIRSAIVPDVQLSIRPSGIVLKLRGAAPVTLPLDEVIDVRALGGSLQLGPIRGFEPRGNVGGNPLDPMVIEWLRERVVAAIERARRG